MRGVTVPSRRARGTRREPSGRCPRRPSHSRPPPSRSGRGSCRRRGRQHARATPRSVPGRRSSSARPSGSSSCTTACASRFDTEIASSEMCLLVRVIGQDAAHQILGDLGKRRCRGDRRGQRERARDRAEIGEAHPHRHGPAGPGLGAQPRPDPIRKMAQRRPEHALFGRLPADRRLGAGRVGAAMRLDLARIAIPRQRRQLVAERMPEQPLQRLRRRLRQLPDGEHTVLGQPFPGDRANAPHQLDRQVVQERELGRGIDDDQAVGLGHLRGDLRQMLRARDADRDRQAELRAHATPDRLRNLGRRTEQVRAARDIGERFVDRDALDQRGEIAQHVDGGIAQPLVLGEMAADEDEVRTELARPPSRHPAAHPEGLRLIGGGQHDSAADRDRLAAQRRVKQLLDRGIEGVQVRMEDGGERPSRSPAPFATRTAGFPAMRETRP